MLDYVPTVIEALSLIEQRRGFTIEDEFGCWLWDETPDSFGPVLSFFEAVNGPLADGMVIFHVCPNGRRGCVRPSHLDALPDDVPIPEPPVRSVELAKFAQLLADERAARRWTLSHMAKHLGIAVSTLTSWESGKSTPAPEQHAALGKSLGWDGKPRKWIVTLVHQRVVVATSSGAAVRQVLDPLEVEGEQLKTEVYEVRRV